MKPPRTTRTGGLGDDRRRLAVRPSATLGSVARGMNKTGLGLTLAVLTGGCVSRAPDLSHWFERVAPDVRVTESTVIAIGMDPSFYYKLEASPGSIEQLIADYELAPFEIGSYTCSKLLEGPEPGSQWWRAQDLGASTCHHGNLKGNIIYLLHTPNRTEAYLYIQNT